MATQYTPILQLALPVTGELNGTWGEVVNDNITSMVEEAIAGLATISTWTANAHTLTTANGTTDEARCAMLVAQDGAGGTALTGAGQIICPNRTKLFVLQNSSSYAVTLKTAAGTGIAVASGDTAFLFCDATNVNACVTQIINGHITGNLTVDGNATIKGNTTLGDATSDTITATARFASDVNPSADNTYDLGTSGNSWRNLYIDGTATIASLVATTADINGGTIDATTIGATTPSTGVFTQVDITAQGDLRLQDTTGGQYVALQAPGTVPASYTLTFPDTDGDAGQALITDGSGVLSWSTSASGDVYGPASATDNAVARFDTTTGKLIQNSVLVVGDDGASVLSVNSASAGLRITQIGAGNALVVEDSANPDSTPFVVTADGKVGIGVDGSAIAGNIAFMVSADNGNGRGLFQRMTDDTGGAQVYLRKGRGTINSPVVVQSGDRLGTLSYAGWGDSSNAYEAASIYSEVDGTPGTGDMPGRLVFSTTRDGASSPTEAMRIRSDQNIAIGTTGNVNVTLTLGKDITGSTTASSIYNAAIVKSDVTGAANINWTNIFTQAAAFTLTSLRHYLAAQNTIGAGSTVTNQQGFYVDSSLTGATNNYGFYSNIASGTGRYNFYAAGTADNYFAGRTGIGALVSSNVNLRIGGNITGSIYSNLVYATGQVQSDVTGSATYFYTATAQAAGFTLPDLTCYAASQGTLSGTVTRQYGFNVDGTFTGATYNYGFYGSITSGANRYNLYMSGNADNYLAGKLGVGIQPASSTGVYISQTTTDAVAYGVLNAPYVGTTTTTALRSFQSTPNTVAGSYTVGSIDNFYATQGTIGAGSTVTNQFGFNASSAITGATNNFGFYSAIASGANRWNFYSAGTAANYFAGQVGICGTAAAYQSLGVNGTYLTNSSISEVVSLRGVIPSGSTAAVSMFLSRPTTQAAAFTLTSLKHYDADPGALGSGSAVTTQYGFFAADTLTGATNNYGFYGNIASGANRYNLYMGGTAANYLNGITGIGSTPFSGCALRVGTSVSGGEAASIYLDATIPSTATAAAIGVYSVLNVAAASFTLPGIRNFYAVQGTIGAGATVTNQYGFQAYSNLTGATNNYGFHSGIAAGSGRFNFYASGTADNYFAGKVGIGVSPFAASLVSISGTLPNSGAASSALDVRGTIPSSTTGSAYIVGTYPTTQAAAFTLSNLYHFDAEQAPLGAGSTVTNQYGFIAQSSLTGATNNYGFYSNIASGSGRYNFYAAGSADNYFAGVVSVGSTLIMSNASPLIAVGSAAVSTGDCHIEVGAQRTGNGNSYIDFIGDTTYTDYGLRLMRQNGGVNANTQLVNRGTGTLYVEALDAGSVALKANGIDGVFVSSSGTVKNYSTISVGNATPASTGAGITFPATQSASSDANTLDDYEEGTWTPALAAASGAPTGYGSRSGWYTKIGNTVNAWGYFSITGAGTLSGSLSITGLPFNNANNYSHGGARINTLLTLPSPGTGQTGVYMNAASAALNIELGTNTGISPLTAAYVQNSTDFMVNITYTI